MLRAITLPMLAACLVLAGPSAATDYTLRGLKIGLPWARPAAQGLNGALYVEVTNTNRAPDVLEAVETKVAKRAVIHRGRVVAGVSSMRAAADGIPIPAGTTVRLAPGGDHVMLLGLTRALVEGTRVPATLVFQRAGRVQVELVIEASAGAASARPPAHDHN